MRLQYQQIIKKLKNKFCVAEGGRFYIPSILVVASLTVFSVNYLFFSQSEESIAINKFLNLNSIEYSKESLNSNFIEKTKEFPKIRHLKTPEPVKGIYISSWVAGIRDWRNELIKFVDSTELNTVIIDVKDYTGRIAFKTDDSELTAIGSPENRIPDIKEFIEELHNHNIYAIARISVFQDAYLAKIMPVLAIKNKQGGFWKDRKGIAWLDPASKEVWDYTVRVAKEAEKAGFDELNFDYIRFPSDGNLANAKYEHWDETTAKSEVIKDFFFYLNENLRDLKIPLSADLFGLTTVKNDDMNIGQILENAVPYFDYISPMVYPSHYPDGFNGYKNPANHPYEIILGGLTRAKERLIAATSSPLKLRPWLQDFDLGAVYDAQMIQKEKQAVYDAGLTSWLIWDPTNKYTRGAYEKE